MRNFLVLSLLALGVPAVAQQIELNVDPFGASVSITPPAQPQPPPPAAQRAEEHAGDGYRLEYRSTDSGATLLEVVEPAGVELVARKGQFTVHRDRVPTSFHADADTWYQVILRAPSGAKLEHRVQARSGMKGTLRFFPPDGPTSPPPLAAGRRPVPGPQFNQLALAIQNEHFSEGRLNVLRSALPGAWFSVEQVGRLVDLFDFSPEKVEVVRLTRDRITDRENAPRLFGRFAFEVDKAKVAALLGAR